MAMDINATRALAASRLRAKQVNQNIPSFAEAALAVARFVRKNGYQAIIMSGRSSLIPRELFLSAWRALFPSISPPTIYNFGDEGNFRLYKGQLDMAERVKSVQSYIDAHLPDLNGRRREKVCFVDDCALAGGKYNGLRGIFEKLGFSSIDFAYLAAVPTFEHRAQDYVAAKDPEIARTLLTLAKDVGRSEPEMDCRDIIQRTIAIIEMKAAA